MLCEVGLHPAWTMPVVSGLETGGDELPKHISMLDLVDGNSIVNFLEPEMAHKSMLCIKRDKTGHLGDI